MVSGPQSCRRLAGTLSSLPLEVRRTGAALPGFLQGIFSGEMGKLPLGPHTSSVKGQMEMSHALLTTWTLKLEVLLIFMS